MLRIWQRKIKEGKILIKLRSMLSGRRLSKRNPVVEFSTKILTSTPRTFLSSPISQLARTSYTELIKKKTKTACKSWRRSWKCWRPSQRRSTPTQWPRTRRSGGMLTRCSTTTDQSMHSTRCTMRRRSTQMTMWPWPREAHLQLSKLLSIHKRSDVNGSYKSLLINVPNNHY